MKGNRDFGLIYHINSHFNDLKEDLSHIDTVSDFSSSKEKRRAILFDFLQIGELASQLSESFKNEFNNSNLKLLISIRNRIVHGYATIRDDIIFETLKRELTPFIKEINAFAHEYYRKKVNELIGKKVKVLVDRPVGYNHNGLIYPINYGSIEDLMALDGEYQDAYLLGSEMPMKEATGVVTAIIQRENDIEDKLVVSLNGNNYSEQEIEQFVSFQEKFFNHRIIK